MASVGELHRGDISFVDTPRARLRVLVAGDGPTTVVFCADPPNVIETHERLVAALAPHFRVVVFEAPGFGHSVPARGFRFTLDEQAAVVQDLLKAVDSGPFVLAFSCVSAYVALEVAAAEPQHVSHVALIQAPAFDEEAKWAKRVDFKGLIGTPLVGQLVMRLAKRRVARAWYANALPKGADAAPFLAPALRAFDEGATFRLADAFQALFRGEPPALPTIHQPALVVWGGADRSHRRTDKASTLRIVPHARVVEFQECGHFPELEAPERFRDALLAFLRTPAP